MKFITTSSLVVLAVSTLPMLAFAQTTSVTDIPSLFTFVLNVINSIVVPLVFAVAFVAFLVGIYIYFIQNGGNPEKRQEGTRFLMWSLIGFFIMFSVWGLINLFLGTLGFNNSAQPTIPTFNATGSGRQGNGVGDGTGGFFGSPGTATGTSIPVGSTISPINGTCPSGSVVSVVNAGVVTGCQVNQPSLLPANATQTSNGISGGAGLGTGTVSTGGTCDSSADCSGDNECNAASHTCQADNGLGQQGDQCTSNDECQDPLVCDENSMTCQDDNAAGISAIGEGAGNVGQGGSCSRSADCSGSLECSQASATFDKCEPDSGLGEQGDECTSDNECDGDLVCDTNSETCQPNDNAGVQETGDGSTGDSGSTSVSCPDGTTADNYNDCDDPQDF